jgi:small subunit ribosomal protein S9
MSERLYHEAVGRRKESTARARVFPGGAGDFIVNDKEVQQYFPRIGDIDKVRSPMLLTQLSDSVDISVHVSGGGVTGQVDATAHAISRALLKLDPDYRSTLRGAGLLTRDARVKERKKPGLKRARKAPTYTKR